MIRELRLFSTHCVSSAPTFGYSHGEPPELQVVQSESLSAGLPGNKTLVVRTHALTKHRANFVVPYQPRFLVNQLLASSVDTSIDKRPVARVQATYRSSDVNP